MGLTQEQLRCGGVFCNEIPKFFFVAAGKVCNARAVLEVDSVGHRMNAISPGEVWEVFLLQDQEGHPVAILGSESLEFGDHVPDLVEKVTHVHDKHPNFTILAQFEPSHEIDF